LCASTFDATSGAAALYLLNSNVNPSALEVQVALSYYQKFGNEMSGSLIDGHW
jgi:hypothetical protein